MQRHLDTSRARECVLVTVHGWPAVQRVVVLLSGRRYVVDALEARPTGREPYWQVCVGLRCNPAELLLLKARLERLPSVTAVLTGVASAAECDVLVARRSTGADPAATGRRA